MSDGVCVDTNIWEYAYVTDSRIDEADLLHNEAKAFLEALLLDASRAIILSDYQVSEIMEVLRKAGLAANDRQAIFDLFWTDKCQVVPMSREITFEAFALSKVSNIHIYDYLVALPLRGLITVIYTADEHFNHAHFQNIAKVENPLSWIVLEGQRPRKRT